MAKKMGLMAISEVNGRVEKVDEGVEQVNMAIDLL
jgi:hypothetical protein